MRTRAANLQPCFLNARYVLAFERAFRRASEAHPNSDIAFNNLAHVLAELGRLADAETAARAAVSLQGPSLPETQKTLEAILARRK